MTAILWKNNTLYTDSLVEIRDNYYSTNNKAISVRYPAKLTSPIRWNAAGKPDDKGEPLDDWIVGATWDGAKSPALSILRVINKLTAAENDTSENTLDDVMTAYSFADKLHVANTDNMFTLLAIGVKANYLFTFMPGREFEFFMAPKSRLITLGSGQTPLEDINEAIPDADPIRMMHYASNCEKTCQGPYYAWQVEKHALMPSGHLLTRVGMWEEATSVDLDYARLLAKQPVEPALTRFVATPSKHPRTTPPKTKRKSK